MRCWHTPSVEAHWRTPGTEAQDDGPQPATRERMSAARMAARDEGAHVRAYVRAPHMAGAAAAQTSLVRLRARGYTRKFGDKEATRTRCAPECACQSRLPVCETQAGAGSLSGVRVHFLSLGMMYNDTTGARCAVGHVSVSFRPNRGVSSRISPFCFWKCHLATRTAPRNYPNPSRTHRQHTSPCSLPPPRSLLASLLRRAPGSSG